jgi:hypothetical protein
MDKLYNQNGKMGVSKMLTGKAADKNTGRPRHKWEDNMRIYLK